MSMDEVKAQIKNPSTPMLELAVANILKHAVEKGDQLRAEWLLQRLLGKVKEHPDTMRMEHRFVVRDQEGTEQAEVVMAPRLHGDTEDS